MTSHEKLYTSLCVVFSSLIILGNITFQKFVKLEVPLYQFEISVGALLYPLSFLVSNLITEFYGKEKATFCAQFAIVINVIMAVIIAFMDYLPATPWSKIDNETFHKVFGLYSISFIGSLIACYVSQIIDIRLYLWISKRTKGKYLWLRSNGSTCISLLIDTIIVVGFLTLFGVLAKDLMWQLIANSFGN